MAQKFTFHIPNSFRRDLNSDSHPDYSQLPRNEDEEALTDGQIADDQGLNGLGEATDGDQANLFGVDSTLSWKRKSSVHKTFTWLAFGTLGAAVLLPFNALITPSEYYRSILASTPYARSFSSWIIVAYNVSTICVGAIATASLEKTTPARRISISSLVILISLILFTIYTSKVSIPSPASTSSPENSHFFPLLISLTLILASATAFLQSSVVGLCASYGGGGKAMGSMLSGQGLVAVALSSVQLIASFNQVSKNSHSITDNSSHSSSLLSNETSLKNLKSESEQAQKAAMTFFASSAILMLFALLSFAWTMRTDVFKEIESRRIESAIMINKRRQNTTNSNSLLNERHENQGEEEEEEAEAEAEEALSGRNWGIQERDILPAFISERISSSSRDYVNRIWKIQSKVLISSLTICLVFALTLGVFPALTSRVESTSTIPITPPSSSSPASASSPSSIISTAFTPIRSEKASSPYLSNPLFFTSLHFFLFNLSDLTGRSLPSLKASLFLIKSFKVVLISSILRFLFIPLLRSCNLRQDADQHQDVISVKGAFSFLSTDWAFFILLILLGVSNGMISTSVFVIGPGPRNQTLTNDERPLAASIISLWLTVGLALGSISSFWIAR